MSFSIATGAVYFIACHGGPADHFATFADALSKKGSAVEIIASGPALKKFQDRGIQVKNAFSLDKITSEEEDLLAEQIAKACAKASVVITDVGHSFDIKIQKTLASKVSHVRRLAYYDNPESFVPGGYSKTAAEVMLAAQGIVFANSNHAKEPIYQTISTEVDFEKREKIGIGYYPLEQVDKIAQRRLNEQASMRKALFLKNNLLDDGQKVLVYYGGNNDEYFSKAFPKFLTLIHEGILCSDLSNVILILQQHPGAKTSNIDGKMLSDWINYYCKNLKAPKIIVSDFSSEDAQVIADAAFYYQTSMAPQFLLAGIPTIQIGHETYNDILVRNNLSPSVTNVQQLIEVLKDLSRNKKHVQQKIILDNLGINKNWLDNLEKLISCS